MGSRAIGGRFAPGHPGGPGRPPEDPEVGARTVKKAVRLSPEEAAAWIAEAAADKRSFSDWVRLAVERTRAERNRKRTGKTA